MKTIQTTQLSTAANTANHAQETNMTASKPRSAFSRNTMPNHSIVHLAVMGAFMAGSQMAYAQASSTVESAANGRYTSAVPNNSARTLPVAVLDGMYAANAKVGRINVKVRNADVPADGRSELFVDVTVYDMQDKLMTEPVLITIENNGGKVLLQGTANDEFGPTSKDADRLVPGVQMKVLAGAGTFSLVAPSSAQDVNLRITAGNAQANGVIPFNLDLREMVAAGLIEGSLRLSKQSSSSTISPVRLNDGFEQEITRWSRTNTSSNGNERTVDARAAMFLKGKIAGDALLTMSFDSDKETRARLLRDIKPEEFYPVYGDASIKGFEARSSDRLYVRIDKNRSFAMYGDYNTGDGFSQAAGTGVVAGTNLRQLGTYNRTLTGLKGHVEGEAGFINGFAAYDTLKNVTEEIRTNGTSGPFAVDNATGLENSEKVEVLVRDRNNTAVILSVTALARLNDYVFEPFSARILLSRPIPSQDSNGNPMSLRISYEVDQGGKKFLVAGVDGQVNLGNSAVVGASYVQDKNPNAPVKLASINAGIKLGDKTTLVAEVAKSTTSLGAAGIEFATLTNPSSMTEKTGKAARIELDHKGDTVQANVYVNKTEAGFSNTSSGPAAGGGTVQAGVKANLVINPTVSLNGEVQYVDNIADDGRRLGAKVGIAAKVTDSVQLSLGLRHSQERGIVAGTSAGIGCNPNPGSTFANGSNGGFTGAQSSTILNVNGSINCPNTTGSGATATTDATSNTLILGAQVQLSDNVSAGLTLETGKTSGAAGINASDRANRIEGTLAYQVAERTRLYARADTQRGLASQYALDKSDKSSSVSLGVDSTYMQGGNVFSEYRLTDSTDNQQSQLASGLRNAWQVGEGVLLSTGIERLKLLSGSGQNATAATMGLDYTRSELWKAGGKVEWRRLDSPATNTNVGTVQRQDTLLFTLNAARKLNDNWSLLGRNYYLATNNHGEKPNGWQDRVQVGFAYRPLDNNRFDALAKLEYKTENNINGANEYYKALVGALQTNFHPSRPWWFTGRVAAKVVNERFPNTEANVADSYKAYLLGGRVVYDVTEKMDIGLSLGAMSGKAKNQNGSSVQKQIGLEAGYAMASNLWASIGYNFSGYTDKDLTSDYTGKGAYLRLRYKFDQDLFQGGNPAVNNTLERSK